ncbi:MAG: division/cell wall cluster transcriptional repressor MraZ [Bacteroidales bacterium]|nr:division/cell wall cluster transcriptional repressor MraZ [Bacteroidales bacterium]
MSYLVGHYNCKLDTKGRILVPSEFKEQLGEQVEEGFVLRPGLHAHCLELYTRKDWDEVQDQLRSSFSQFKAKQEAVLRKYNAGARFVKLDASGRLLIGKDLIDRASLVKDIVITSVTTKMEIWDKDLYEQSISGDLSDEEFFDLLSESIK